MRYEGGGILVLDASVAVKWYLPEEDSEYALEVLEAGMRGSVRLIAPEMILAEVGNVLWLRNRRGHISRERVASAWESFMRTEIDIRATANLMPLALDIALETGCAVYDALYIALAVATGSQVITADRKLLGMLESTPFSDTAELIGAG